MEDLPLVTFTVPSLLGLAILLVLTGRLVPRLSLKDKIEECDRWRDAYEAEREARLVSDSQTVELLELAKTTNALIRAMLRVSNVELDERGPSNDASP